MHGELIFQSTSFKWTTCYLECFKCPFEARMCSLLKALGHCNFCPNNLCRMLKWAAAWQGYPQPLLRFSCIQCVLLSCILSVRTKCISDKSAHFLHHPWANITHVALKLKMVLENQNFGKEPCRKQERNRMAWPLFFLIHYLATEEERVTVEIAFNNFTSLNLPPAFVNAHELSSFHRTPEWVRLEAATVGSSGPTSLKQDHRGAHGTG